MTEQTTNELEREAEAVRASVADTAESIRRKLTAGQLFDEFTDMFTGGDLSGAVGNLKSQVRDNPMPVVLVGAGLAWLAFGRGTDSHRSAGGVTRYPSRHAPPPRAPGDDSSGSHASVMDRVSGAAGSVADSATSAARSVSDSVGNMADSLSEKADRLRDSMLTGASRHAPHMPRSLSSLTNQEPLLVAVAGVAVGALIGAMLPATELEKEQLGPQAERLREQASDLVDKGRESASRVASQTYDAVKEEADRQGLAAGDRSIGEKVGEVVRSAANAGEDAAKGEMGVGDGAQTRKI